MIGPGSAAVTLVLSALTELRMLSSSVAVAGSGVLFFSAVISAAMSAKAVLVSVVRVASAALTASIFVLSTVTSFMSCSRSFRISNAISTAHGGGPKNI